MARSSECTEQYAQNVFDSAGIVRGRFFTNCEDCPAGWRSDSFRFADNPLDGGRASLTNKFRH
jgi:hypothetical protein